MSFKMDMFAQITKVDAAQRLVYGSLASEVVAKANEVFDYESSKPFVEEWSGAIAKATDGKSVGNLRAMHTNEIAGKFVALECNDKTKSIDVCAKVLDDKWWNMVAEGAVTGFSIGGSYVKKWTDSEGKKRYTAKPSEGSLVDNPCNPDSTFTMVKADGSSELRKFTPPAPAAAEPAPEPTGPKQVWEASDGKTFATKALAKQHEDDLVKAKSEAATPAAQLASTLAQLSGSVAKLEDAAKAAETAAPAPAAETAPPAPDAPAAAAAATEPVAKKDFTQDERDKAAKAGEALPDGTYPIQNKADLKNAIEAFGRAKNKKAVKAHIVKRAKDLDAEDMLPESWKPGADKAVRFGDLRKDLYGVCRLAQLLQELEYCQQSQEWEEAREGDAESTLPEQLKQDVANLAATLRAMVEEETNELLDDNEMLEFGELLEAADRPRGADALAKVLGDKAPAFLAKVGAKHSKGDQELLNKAHDCLKGLGVGCGVAKAGARHSKDTIEKLTKAHDCLKSAGAECVAKDDVENESGSEKPTAYDEPPPPPDQASTGPGKSPEAGKTEDTGDLAKLLDDERAKTTKLEKFITDTNATMQEVLARIEKIEKLPLAGPRELAYRTVTKGDEDAEQKAKDAAQFLEDLRKRDPEAAARALIAMAQQNPMPYGG